ncbi:MAG: hypothetical protein OEM02_13380, partial [Desulfobulbaceae bacterium]|nr:hypothetical protein [Desulfobulbaceae bacterium]
MLIWLQKWLCAITPFILSALTAMPVTAVIAVTAGTADGSPPTWRVAEKQTLFNGTAGDIMQPHNAHGGNFKTHARYEDGFLVVDVPEGANWGKVGLLSKKPAVWMDDFGHKAETRVVYTFDPKRTSGFGLALTLPGSGGVGGNDPSYPGVRYYWIRNAEGTAAKSELHIDPHRRDNYWHEETTPEAPQQVAVVLRPGSVAIELDGVEKVRRDWNVVGEGSGLHVYVFSHPPAAKIPVRMALKDISISRRFSTGTKGPTPVVQPLPPTVLFT